MNRSKIADQVATWRAKPQNEFRAPWFNRLESSFNRKAAEQEIELGVTSPMTRSCTDRTLGHRRHRDSLYASLRSLLLT